MGMARARAMPLCTQYTVPPSGRPTRPATPASLAGIVLPRGLTVDLHQHASAATAAGILSDPLTFRMGDTGFEPVTSAV